MGGRSAPISVLDGGAGGDRRRGGGGLTGASAESRTRPSARARGSPPPSIRRCLLMIVWPLGLLLPHLAVRRRGSSACDDGRGVAGSWHWARAIGEGSGDRLSRSSRDLRDPRPWSERFHGALRRWGALASSRPILAGRCCSGAGLCRNWRDRAAVALAAVGHGGSSSPPARLRRCGAGSPGAVRAPRPGSPFSPCRKWRWRRSISALPSRVRWQSAFV